MPSTEASDVAKRKNPHLAAWQEAARERLRLVCERKFHGRQSPLAGALGVSHTLVSLVLRSVQPPTRNLMARVGAIEGVNPRWADTGEGEPFAPAARGTLPVSDVLLPGPPADHPALLTGERFAAAPAFDRPSCYFWRLPAGHPAAAVDDWRLKPGDLLLLETSREAAEVPGGLPRRWCVLDGECLGRADPVYGSVTADSNRRTVFSDGRSQLRLLDPRQSDFAPPDIPPVSRPGGPQLRRRVMPKKEHERRAAEREADPWFWMPAFETSQVLAVQLLMVRS